MTTDSTTASLRALMRDLIDYAGLFPPATLDMATAVRRYEQYRRGPAAWLLGRFIVPAGRLAELGEAASELLDPALPLRLSVLARGGASSEEFLANIEDAMSQIADFQASHGAAVRIEMLECPLPADILDTLNLMDDSRLFGRVADRAEPLGDAPIYFEVAPSERWAERVALAIEAIADYNRSVGRRATGFKLRCGGTPDPAFPSAEQIAYVLDLCQAARVPLKATAGLHHPVRHFDAQSNHMRHGFFNLFGAGMLAWTHGLSMNSLVAIVQDQDATSFHFGDDRFTWKEWGVATDQLARLRREAFISYGSCSFTEPVEDLHVLGYLPAVEGTEPVVTE